MHGGQDGRGSDSEARVRSTGQRPHASHCRPLTPSSSRLPQMNTMKDVSAILAQEMGVVKLLVVDSIMVGNHGHLHTPFSLQPWQLVAADLSLTLLLQ